MSETQPLAHKRILVMRSSDQAELFCEKLEALGAVPIRFPVIRFNPLPAPGLNNALSQLEQYDWLIFTSGNAVTFFLERVAGGKLHVASISSRIAAVGSATQNLLAVNNIPVDFVPEQFTGEQLVLGLGDVAGKRILLPRAKIGRPEIVAMLRERGAVVDEFALYDTITAVPTQVALDELAKGVDVIIFTSPSSVRNFLKILETRPQGFQKPLGSKIAVIGPSTAEEAQTLGLNVDIMPDEYTIDGLITAVVKYMQSYANAENAER